MPKKLAHLQTQCEIQLHRVEVLLDCAVAASENRQDASKVAAFRCRYSKLADFAANFNEYFDALCRAASDTEDGFKRYLPLDEAFLTACASIEACYIELFPPEPQYVPSTSVTTSPAVKLPKIELPQFSGSFQDWIGFKELYDSLIHTNAALSNIQKCQYLLSALSGDAADRLKGIVISDANYQLAYDTLVSHYDSKRRLTVHCWESILNVRYDSRSSLRTIANTFRENLATLHHLGYTIDHFSDFILFQTLFSKLEPSLRQTFERLQPDSKAIPEFKTLQTFLERECHAFEISQTCQNQTPIPLCQTPRCQTVSVLPPNPGCPFCPQRHPIYLCPTFIAQKPSVRLQMIRQERRCYNCFAKHRAQHCKSSRRCLECKQRHHSMLHSAFGADSVVPPEFFTAALAAQPSDTVPSPSIKPPAKILTPVTEKDAPSPPGRIHSTVAVVEPNSSVPEMSPSPFYAFPGPIGSVSNKFHPRNFPGFLPPTLAEWWAAQHPPPIN